MLAGHVQVTLAPFVHAGALGTSPQVPPDTAVDTQKSQDKSADQKTPADLSSSIAVTVTVVNLTTGDEPVLPHSFFLNQNFPNPFNAATVIAYGIPEEMHVRLDVFNVLGQHVATLADGVQAPGRYEATWDAEGNASGVFFYRMKAGSFSRTRHMIQLK